MRQAIKRHGDNIAVLWSAGKASTLALWYAIKVNPNVKVIHGNTMVEFPEIVIFKNKIRKKWKLNFRESKPLKSFWRCVDKYGLPKPRKTGGKGPNSPKCCYYLKEEPARILQEELGVNAIITGLQACESRSRNLLAKRYDNGKAPYMSAEHEGEIVEFCAQRWFTKKTATWTYHPIIHWSTDEVWAYIKEKNLPINEVYTKWGGIYPRCGCLPCTAYTSWEDRLSVSHPKLYRHLKSIQCPEQTTLLK